MNRILETKYWKLSDEISQAKDYYKFLDDKVVSKVDELYESGKFSNQRALEQDDPRNAPVIFQKRSSIIKISRFKPLFGVQETNLQVENLSKKYLFFKSKELFRKGEKLVFEIPFNKKVFLLCEVDYNIRRSDSYLYRTQINPSGSFAYTYYLQNIRATEKVLSHTSLEKQERQ